MKIGKPSFTLCFYFGHLKVGSPGQSFVHLYGLTEWSDGEQFSQLPSFEKSKLQRCGMCSHFFWSTQRLRGLYFEDHVEAADYFEKKYSKKNFFNYLNKLRNKERLVYIRTMILRQYNNQIRVHPLSKPLNWEPKVISEENRNIFINNAKLLIDLLTEINSEDLFLLAELHRNIGEFDKAKRILNQLPDSHKKELLLNQIEKKNCDVITVIEPLTRE
jgi:hypothetical protein